MRFNRESHRHGFGRPALQRGEGFGSFITKIFQKVLPYTKHVANAGSKLLKNETVKKASKQILDTGLDTIVNVAADTITNGNLKQNAENRLKEARENIGTVLRETRKRKNSNLNTKKKNIVKKRKIVLKKASLKKKKKKKNFNIFDDDA